jgi:hypothetical protein
MAANNAPIFPVAPIVGIASLTSATALTARTNITGTAGLTQLTVATTNGKRVDAITVSAKGTTVAGAVDLWIYNGTTSFYFASIDITANTASTTNDPLTVTRTFANLVLPAACQLFVSETVQQDLNVFAFGGDY